MEFQYLDPERTATASLPQRIPQLREGKRLGSENETTLMYDTLIQHSLCCQCGTPIEPNPSNTCVACLRTQVDITEGIPKQANIYFCKGCERYLQPPSNWVSCSLESRELLSLCLKRLKGLGKVHLVDAGFVWTEPHSKRIKTKLTVQKEVMNSAILQQVFVVEYTVHHQMCEECHRREAQDFWRAVVQVRQKATHKKTFLYLEQLILKHRAHGNTLRIKESHEGIDFFYAQKQDARKLVNFLTTVVPCKYKTSQELVSHDVHNSTYQYKHSFSVEIVPICKNDVVCLPLKLARLLGNINQIVICNRVTTAIQIIDPKTLQTADISSAVFWRTPFSSLCDHRQLTEFYILNIEPVQPHTVQGSLPNLSEKCILADAWVVPLRDLGSSDRQFHCRTHLGHLLQTGDTAWGFNFTSSNVNDTNLEKMKDIPDVVLVKKSYGDRKKRHRQRNWHLQQLDREMGVDSGHEAYQRDYDEFLEDLEEDKVFRKNVDFYLTPNFVPPLDVTNDVPQIGIEELLQQMSIQEGGGQLEEMATE